MPFKLPSETWKRTVPVVAPHDAAKVAADRASASIDDTLTFIEASNRRIAAMERKAATQVVAVASGRPRAGTRKAA